MTGTTTEGMIVAVRSTATPAVLVAMPGAGFDGAYAARAFGPAAAALGVPVVAADPDPADWASGFDRVLSAAARTGPVLAGGISIGACAAVRWAATHPARCVGVWAALPPWSGPPADAPAAAAARFTAQTVEAVGLDAAIEQMRASSPPWLAAELDRSWRSIAGASPDGAALATLLRAVADHVAPTPALLAALRVPIAVTVADDDPVHPAAVGAQWAAAAGRAALAHTRLDAIGADAGELGRRCAQGWAELT